MRKAGQFSIAVDTLALCLLGSALQASIWTTTFDLNGRTNDYRSGAGGQLVMPLSQNQRALSFIQADLGHWYKLWAGSLGCSYRRLAGASAWGVNGFIDTSRSEHRGMFWQGGLGAEWLTPHFEARVNGYIPFTSSRAIFQQQFQQPFLVGLNAFANTVHRTRREVAYNGFDLEAGAGFDIGASSIWAYAGYFYYDASHGESFNGPRIRAEYRTESIYEGMECYLRGEWEYNRINHSYGSALIGFRFPFGGASTQSCSLSSVCRRMGRPVWRNEGILVRESTRDRVLTTQPVLTADGMNQLQVIFANATGGGPGTQSAPDTIVGAVATANPGDTIVLLNNAGVISTAGTVNMEDDQSLAGFGESNNLRLPIGGGTLPLFDNSGRATLLATVGGSVVDAGGESNVVLRGFTADGNGISGIRAIEAGNSESLTVVDTILTNVRQGIRLLNADGTNNIINNQFINIADGALLHKS